MRRLALALLLVPPAAAQVAVGTARVDITPDGPIRLSGYGSRTTESETVEQRLFAGALAIGSEEPVLLLAVENCGVPAHVTETVARRLAERAGLARERLTIASTHTHSAPMLTGNLENLFGRDIPEDQRERIERYTDALVEKLVRAGEEALAARAPAALGFAKGSATFAANRRTPDGPVDHDVEVLAAEDAEGTVRAVVANYACHCTTMGGGFNDVCGDWAGYAREGLEAAYPGAVVLVTIGCGADANPGPRGTLELAKRHGRELADEVRRVLSGDLTPIGTVPTARLETIALPFAAPRTRAEWEARAARNDAIGYHARKNLARLDRGAALPVELAYPVQAWAFGDELAWTFLPGEVVVDYALRLDRELAPEKSFVTAYANDVPCYIPSERILREGGYEAEGAMVYYDQPNRLAVGVEERIVAAVHRVVPDGFRTGPAIDTSKTDGVAPLDPDRSLSSIQVREGLEVRLAAAEPYVVDPIAIDFGPDGRLWVVEMGDYPAGVDGDYAPGGRVRVLEDIDDDQEFEWATTFLDGLPFPTDVKVWRDGALICAAPDILFARDTDGDGYADDVRTLYTGFATTNYQARVNSLRFGLDGWVYGANGLLGGTVESFSGARLELGGSDFRIRPDTGEIETASGLTQQGRARNDFGDWFGCDNSTLAWHYPLSAHYLARNPHVDPPPARVTLGIGRDPNRLFPISAPAQRFNEPSKQSRTTSACGLDLYRDDALGEEYQGDLFVCEPVHNLEPHGATYVGRRPRVEPETEFLASTDPWFRPVQVRTGPDGALWVVDMYRFVIEHPRWIPEARQAELDLRAGDGLGRIYRVVPTDRELAPAPRIDGLEGEALARALATSNGTVRDLAHQTLVWGGAPAPTEALESLVSADPRPEVRVQSLCALADLGVLSNEAALRGLGDEHDDVRRVAIRLSEPFLRHDGDIANAANQLGPGRVVAQSVLSLGEAGGPTAAVRLVVAMWLHGNDPYVTAAALSSVRPSLGVVMAMLPSVRVPPETWKALVLTALRDRNDAALALAIRILSEEYLWERIDLAVMGLPDEYRTPFLYELSDPMDERDRYRAAADLLDTVERTGETLDSLEGRSEILDDALSTLRPTIAASRGVALDPAADVELRQPAVRLLGCYEARLRADLQALRRLLGPDEPASIRDAALRRLRRMRQPEAASAILASWPELGPRLREAAVDALLARPDSTRRLLRHLESEPRDAGMFDAGRRRRLLEHPDDRIRRLAEGAFQDRVDATVEAELERFAGVGRFGADAARGADVFARVCATCHALDDVGTDLGPDLTALSDLSDDVLLVAILDPNREVLAPYADYVLRTTDGRLLGGVVTEDGPYHVRLVEQGGVEHVVQRSEIEALVDQRRSFMPEGLGAELTVDEMRDLLAFLRRPRRPPKAFDGNRPVPVRADAAGVWTLAATNAEIYGDDIVYEAQNRNLGYWHGPADRAVWTVVVDEPCEVDVEVEWACADDSAGETFVLEGAGAEIRARVEGTGGWSEFRKASVGHLSLPTGRHRFVVRPESDPRRALFDLRAFRLVRE